MSKKCKTCGANCEGELCFRCKPRKPLKQTPIKKSNKPIRAKNPNKVYNTEWGFENQVDMFRHIWDETIKNDPEGRVKSEISGRDITGFGDTPMWINCFLHILSKSESKFPKFRLNPNNIMLGHPQEHTVIDHGTEKQRIGYERLHSCSFEVFYDKYKELEIEYNNKFN